MALFRSALTVMMLVVAVVSEAQSTLNVMQWRGVRRDGVFNGFTPPDAWPEQLTQRWKVDVGSGYATPLLVGNRVFVFSRQGDDEVMSALDVASGKVVWRTAYPAPFTMHSAASVHGPGPKSTPAYSIGRIFAIGMTGIVTAYDAVTGKQLWQKPGSTLVPTFTTHAFSPIVENDLVIFHVGGHDKGALTAFDVSTGDVKWSWGGDGPGYGSPMVTTLSGTRQLITMTQQKLVGVDLAKGTLLWEVPYVTQATTNSGTPLEYYETLIVGGNGRPVEAYAPTRRDNKWVVDKVWENADVTMRMTNPLVVGDTIFSLSAKNMGQYFVLDAKTGKTLWTSEGRQATNASLVKAGASNLAGTNVPRPGGGTIVSLESDGELVVMRPNGTAIETVRRYKVADTETWTQPSVSLNRILVKDVTGLTLWTVD